LTAPKMQTYYGLVGLILFGAMEGAGCSHKEF
jgi:hypothetical protein